VKKTKGLDWIEETENTKSSWLREEKEKEGRFLPRKILKLEQKKALYVLLQRHWEERAAQWWNQVRVKAQLSYISQLPLYLIIPQYLYQQ